MSKKVTFLGGTSSRLHDEFREKSKYRRLVDFEGMIDTLYDKYFYGFINSKYEPSYIVDDPEVFSNITGVAEDVRCLGFVASAFQAFRDDYSDRINNSDKNFPPFLEGVRPVSGYEPLSGFYGEYLSFVGSSYSNLMKSDVRINDYHCFLTALEVYFEKSLKNWPVTRSGFLLSRYNNVRSSGIVLELSKLDYDIDFNKGEILQSPDFKCFLDYARSYGFLVDKNAPWRLYADIEHDSIKMYLKRGLQSGNHLTNSEAEDIMDSIYRLKSGNDDLYDLQDFVVKLYNDLRTEVPFYKRPVRNRRSKTAPMVEDVFRPEITMLSSEQWLGMLLKVRMLEMDVYEKGVYQKNLKKVADNFKAYGLNQAIKTISNITSEYLKEIYERNREDSTDP